MGEGATLELFLPCATVARQGIHITNFHLFNLEQLRQFYAYADAMFHELFQIYTDLVHPLQVLCTL